MEKDDKGIFLFRIKILGLEDLVIQGVARRTGEAMSLIVFLWILAVFPEEVVDKEFDFVFVVSLELFQGRITECGFDSRVS